MLFSFGTKSFTLLGKWENIPFHPQLTNPFGNRSKISTDSFFFFISNVLCEIKLQEWKCAASVLRIFPTLLFQRDLPERSGTPARQTRTAGLASIARLTKHAPRVLRKTFFLPGELRPGEREAMGSELFTAAQTVLFQT